MLNGLKTGAFIDRERVLVYPSIFLVLISAATIYVLGVYNGLLPNGVPFGSDFVSFWVAAREALAGNAGVPYEPALFASAQKILFPEAGYFAFFYPPHYLIYMAPLGALPYYAALTLWMSASFAAAYWVLTSISGRPKETFLLALAFPAAFLTIGHGQNAFLSAALFGGGLLLLDRRPIVAGVLFGLLTFKPQLGFLIPLILVAGGYWRTILSAGLTLIVLIAASMLSFGVDIWVIFWDQADFAVQTMREGLVEWYKMISLYASLRILGLGDTLSSMVHWTFAAIVAAITLWAWLPRNQIEASLRKALVLSAALIVTPFGLNYDMFLLAPAMAFFVAHGLKAGFFSYEKSILAIIFISPFAVLVFMVYEFSLAPIFTISMFVLVLRRIHLEAKHVLRIA